MSTNSVILHFQQSLKMGSMAAGGKKGSEDNMVSEREAVDASDEWTVVTKTKKNRALYRVGPYIYFKS